MVVVQRTRPAKQISTTQQWKKQIYVQIYFFHTLTPTDNPKFYKSRRLTNFLNVKEREHTCLCRRRRRSLVAQWLHSLRISETAEFLLSCRYTDHHPSRLSSIWFHGFSANSNINGRYRSTGHSISYRRPEFDDTAKVNYLEIEAWIQLTIATSSRHFPPFLSLYLLILRLLLWVSYRFPRHRPSYLTFTGKFSHVAESWDRISRCTIWRDKLFLSFLGLVPDTSN